VELAVQEMREDPDMSWSRAAAIVGQRLGINASTVRNWREQAEVSARKGESARATDGARIMQLEAENRELRRANEVLRAAYILASGEFDETLPECASSSP
jgi:transposase-like protein